LVGGAQLHCRYAVFHRVKNGGSGEVKRIVGLLVIVLVAFFIITQPAAAAASVQSILSTLRSAAESVTSFFTRIVT